MTPPPNHSPSRFPVGLALFLAALSPLLPTSAAPATWPRHTIDNSSIGADGVRLADVNHDGLLDVVTGWEEGGLVRVCVNPGPSKAQNSWPAVTVGQAQSVEDAVLVDLDGNNRLDVVSSSEGNHQSILIHWAPDSPDAFLTSEAWITQPIPVSIGQTRWMFTAPLQIDGQYGIDLIAGSKNPNGQIGWLKSPQDPRKLNDWTWHLLRPAGWIMSLIPTDMDGDGDADLLFSDRKGPRRGCFWLERPSDPLATTQPWPEHPVGALQEEVMFLTLTDLDHDGLLDVVAAIRPTHLLYLRRETADGRSWTSHKIPLPPTAGGAKGVAAGDINADGKTDLVFTCEGAVNKSGVMWLEAGSSPAWTAHDISGSEGIKYDIAELIDLDSDGDLDVLTCEEREGLGVIWYENPLLAR